MEKLGGRLRTAEGGVPADANRAAEHLHLHTCGRGVGDVPVGFFGDAGDGKGLRRARADDAGVHEGRQRLAGSAQPYGGGLQFAGASGGDAADAGAAAAQAAELRCVWRVHATLKREYALITKVEMCMARPRS